MGDVSDKVKELEKKFSNNSKHQNKKDLNVVLAEKGESNKRKRYLSYTNVEKAKDLLRNINRETQSYSDIIKYGFKFSYEDEELPTKFKQLFGKDGVMDLLADALMTKDRTSTKVYSFADMRNELKVYYKNLKLETFKTGIVLDDEKSNQTMQELIKELEEILSNYKSEMEKCLTELKKTSKRSKSIGSVTKVIQIVSVAISILGSIAAQPEIAVIGAAISTINKVIRVSNELYLHIKVNLIKNVINKYQMDINKKYKEIKKEYIKILLKSNDTTNKTLVIKRYNKDSLKKFSQICEEVSDKYHVKISKFKIWSKELNKQKEIFKCGIKNLMEN